MRYQELALELQMNLPLIQLLFVNCLLRVICRYSSDTSNQQIYIIEHELKRLKFCPQVNKHLNYAYVHI